MDELQFTGMLCTSVEVAPYSADTTVTCYFLAGSNPVHSIIERERVVLQKDIVNDDVYNDTEDEHTLFSNSSSVMVVDTDTDDD